jgi:hypothetical protein
MAIPGPPQANPGPPQTNQSPPRSNFSVQKSLPEKLKNSQMALNVGRTFRDQSMWER